MKIFIITVLVIVMAICVMAIYDARRLGEKFFSSPDKNKITKLIKMISFIILVICGITFCIIN